MARRGTVLPAGVKGSDQHAVANDGEAVVACIFIEHHVV
jgi:hypothetical protein